VYTLKILATVGLGFGEMGQTIFGMAVLGGDRACRVPCSQCLAGNILLEALPPVILGIASKVSIARRSNEANANYVFILS